MNTFLSLLTSEMMEEEPEGNFAKFCAFIDQYKDDLKKLQGEEKKEIIHRIIKIANYDNVDVHELGLLRLPESLGRRIENMNGSNPVLVIHKVLFKTDVSPHHGRLSMPESQIRPEFFLFLEELGLLGSQNGSNLLEIKATLIGPSRQFECGVTLKKWDTNSTYNLRSGWSSCVSANDLREGMAVQVWAFRKESKLCFALVKVGGDDDDEEDE